MATTKIWSVKKRLDHVIDYATNPKKTDNELYKELHNVIEYAQASYKTEKQLYVSAINCSKENSCQDMLRTKRRYNKTEGILGFHAFQSFAENEVDAKTAHEIGVRLAEELWGDRFEVVVSTHLNTNHIHNHFVLNSVSFKDGKKYYDNHSNYAYMRETSDRICEEYNLSVIKEKRCPKSKIDYRNYYKSQINKSKIYNVVREDIDYAIEQAYTFNDFVNIMSKLEYEIINRSGKLSVKPKSRKRNIRIERIFGEQYSIDNINTRIKNTEAIRIPFVEVRTLNRNYKAKRNYIRTKRKITGIRALYFYYCHLLKVYPQKKRVMSNELREELKKMNSLSNQARFLVKNKIQTQEDLERYKADVNRKIYEIKSKREYLYKKRKNTKDIYDKELIGGEIEKYSNMIRALKVQKDKIEKIEERIPEIKEQINEMEEQETQQKNIRRER